MHKTWAVQQSKATALLALLSTLAAAPAQAVNKCTGADGQVVYQDAPCLVASAASSVNLAGAGVAQPQSAGASYWRREITRLERASRIESAVANRSIIIGMSANEAVRSWGQPAKVNTSVGAYGRREQWVYRRGGQAAQYVYVDDGVVTSVQTSE